MQQQKEEYPYKINGERVKFFHDPMNKISVGIVPSNKLNNGYFIACSFTHQDYDKFTKHMGRTVCMQRLKSLISGNKRVRFAFYTKHNLNYIIDELKRSISYWLYDTNDDFVDCLEEGLK